MNHETSPPTAEKISVGSDDRRDSAPESEFVPPHPPTGARFVGQFLTFISVFGAIGFETVTQGWVRELTAFGKYRRLLQPGISWYLRIWGLYERPGRWIPSSEQTREWVNQHVLTNDGVECQIAVMICYRIVDAMRALYEIDNYHGAIDRVVQAALRNACGKLRAQEMFSSRDKMVTVLRESLTHDIAPWGVQVRLVEITKLEMMR